MTAKEPFARQLIVLEKNRVLDALLGAAIPLGLLFFVLFAAYQPFIPGALGIHVAVIAAALRFGAARQNSLARPHERQVRASAEGLFVDGVEIPRKRIAAGRYQPRPPVNASAKKRPAGSAIQLFDRYNRIVFEAEVDTEEDGIALLRALGLDASQRRAEFRVAPPFLRTQARSFLLVVLGAAFMFAVRKFTLLLGPFVPLLFFPFLLFAVLPSKLIVGRDGLLLRWLSWKKFIAMADIVSAEKMGETGIRLELTGGRTETIGLATHKQRGGVYTLHRDAVLARIREAMASHRDLGAAADVSALVGQAGRTVEEWKAALATFHEADPGYRSAVVREEDLWRVVEDPRAGEDVRAGAAVLLRKNLDDEGKARVRIAAEASASPKLRVALAAAAEESDDGALEALEKVAVTRRR